MPEPYILIKHFQGTASNAESMEVEGWLKENESHQTDYEQYIKIWQSSEEAKTFHQISVDADWSAFQQKLNDSQKVVPLTTKKNIPYFSIAAVIAVLIGLSLIFLYPWDSNSSADVKTVHYTTTSVPKQLKLSDGTTVYLRAPSTFSYPENFTGPERKVKLEGEAYFEVAKDAEHPFIIESPVSQTEVLGTAFNLRAFSDEKSESLYVVEGKVRFSEKENPDNQLILTEEEGASLETNSRKLNNITTSANLVSWKTGKLVFEELPLDLVLKDLERHYGITAAFAPSVSNPNCPVTTAYSDATLKDVLEELSTVLDLSYQLEKNQLIITDINCTRSGE